MWKFFHVPIIRRDKVRSQKKIFTEERTPLGMIDYFPLLILDRHAVHFHRSGKSLEITRTVSREQGSILEKVATSVATTVIWPRNGRPWRVVDLSRWKGWSRTDSDTRQSPSGGRKKGELFAVWKRYNSSWKWCLTYLDMALYHRTLHRISTLDHSLMRGIYIYIRIRVILKLLLILVADPHMCSNLIVANACITCVLQCH